MTLVVQCAAAHCTTRVTTQSSRNVNILPLRTVVVALRVGPAIAQSVQRLATGWAVRGPNPDGGVRDFPNLSRPALRPTQLPIQ